MRLNTLVMAAATCLGLALPSVARADNTTCANAEPLMIGETAARNLAASALAYYKIRVIAGRSYAAILWQPFEDISEGGSDTALTVYDDVACNSLPLYLDIDTDPDTSFPDADGDAKSFTPEASGTWRLQILNQRATPTTARLLVVETTLGSPWWFVGGTNNAFVEIRNNSAAFRSATLTAFTPAGVVCGTTTVSVPANGNTAINIRDYAPCAAALSGSARLTFVGAPGGFTANITTLDGVAGTSFDSPFTPLMGWGASFTAR